MSDAGQHPVIVLDPVVSTEMLSIVILNNRVPVVVLSRAEVERLRHQLDRWLAWDRVRQGTPRTYHLSAKMVDHATGRFRK